MTSASRKRRNDPRCFFYLPITSFLSSSLLLVTNFSTLLVPSSIVHSWWCFIDGKSRCLLICSFLLYLFQGPPFFSQIPVTSRSGASSSPLNFLSTFSQPHTLVASSASTTPHLSLTSALPARAARTLSRPTVPPCPLHSPPAATSHLTNNTSGRTCSGSTHSRDANSSKASQFTAGPRALTCSRRARRHRPVHS